MKYADDYFMYSQAIAMEVHALCDTELCGTDEEIIENLRDIVEMASSLRELAREALSKCFDV